MADHILSINSCFCCTDRPGIQTKPPVGTGRGPIRGRGRGAAGSRAAGGQGRAVLPGYMRNQIKRPAQEVRTPSMTSALRFVGIAACEPQF